MNKKGNWEQNDFVKKKFCLHLRLIQFVRLFLNCIIVFKTTEQTPPLMSELKKEGNMTITEEAWLKICRS